MLPPVVLSLLLAPLGAMSQKLIFKYCTSEDFTGTCNKDDTTSLNHCEVTSFPSGSESLQVYSGVECTIYMDDKNCQSSNSRTYEKGQVPLIPEEWQKFQSYKCVSDD